MRVGYGQRSWRGVQFAQEPALVEFFPHKLERRDALHFHRPLHKILRPTKWLQSFIYAGYQPC